ncbi:MAG: dihydroorotate dehydrogenase electron transfer subunit [Acidobacteriota bacterium]
MPYALQAELIRNRRLPQENYLLTFRAPEICRETLPGQFVMAAPKTHQVVPSPLLKRALAIYSVRGENLAILVKAIGEGTLRLGLMQPGQFANLIGPLGNGFDLTAGRGKVNFLIVGGVGIASVYLLAEKLKQQGDEVHLLYGARTAADLVMLEDFQALDIPCFIATDDGSAGFKGFITAGLGDYMRTCRYAGLNFYTCGPEPMLRAVSTFACAQGIPCQVSVEARMACGFGVCLGCSVLTRDGNRLACSDGPVFQADELVWDKS